MRQWQSNGAELRKVPGAGIEASGIVGDIFVLMRPFVRASKRGVLSTADGTFYLARIPDTIVVPDVAFILWDRLPGRVRPKGYSPVPPDIAVEVITPTDELGDILKKQRHYRAAGVPIVWWVDPQQRTVQVLRDGVLIAELGEDGVLDGGDVLPELRIPVAEIFEES